MELPERFSDPEYLAELKEARGTPIEQYIPWEEVEKELASIGVTHGR